MICAVALALLCSGCRWADGVPVQSGKIVKDTFKGQQCGSYTLRGGTSPALRGLMTWSINWDRYFNWEFMNSHEPFLNALP